MEQFHGMSDGNISISDVIEVIQTTDPGFVESNGKEGQTAVEMSGGQLLPYIEIVEQPASKALRFRYECEGRSAGSIPGVNSTPENKTFPTIRIMGYKGRAVVVVSCVTKDLPHRPHPHNLVGKEACRRGVCTVEVSSDNMTVTFANLGIQCVKKKDIEEALRVREEIRVDPFRTGFEHKRQPTSIDLNAVRLCFQVFLEGTQKGKFNVPLQPVVSDPIFDKKAMSDLVICKLSHCSASVAGGMEMILLCEKVAKEDIQIRFFEEKDGQVVWEGYGDFQPTHVHKQTAIAFRTPSYRMQQVEQPVQVYIQLKRPSDGATSEALPFQMLPLCSGRPAFWSLRKAFARKKADYSTFSKILATESTLLSNAAPKYPRSIDEFNNNDLEVKKSNNKLSALRALNDLYNVKNSLDSYNGETQLNQSNASIANTLKGNTVDFQNNEVCMGKNVNESGKLYAISNNAENERFVSDYNDTSDTNSGTLVQSKVNANQGSVKNLDSGKRADWYDYSEVSKWIQKGQASQKQKTDEDLKNEAQDGGKNINGLLTQVAELDQIYADTHTKLLQTALEQNVHDQPMEVDVCDNQTYTSLQLAMKNPIELFDIRDDRKYEDVCVSKQDQVIPAMTPPMTAKRDVTREFEERLPPLPPKRIRKMPSMPLLPRPISSQVLIDSPSVAPNKNLPSPPTTLPKQGKQGLFSKLFAKKVKRDKEPSLSPVNQNARSSSLTGSMSFVSKSSSQDVSQIPRPSMASVTSVKSLKLDGDETPPYGADLTEAEHYALYTTMAPHATASEFDEMSFYYSPVEDDPDSLRRKRQKFNNSPNSLVLRHVQAEAEKHAVMLNQPIQYNFNIIKPEPADRVSPYGGAVATGGSFPLYPIGTTSPQPQCSIQTLRPQLSPGRTPSPMDYSAYTAPLIQPQLSPQYQPPNTHVMPQPSTSLQVQQQFQYMHQQTQQQQQPSEQLVLSRVTSDFRGGGLQSVNAGGIEGADVTSVLDMDSQQYSFDLSLNQLDSAELAVFGTALSENLSSGLSISDSGKPEALKQTNAEGSHAGETSSMTDSFTRLTNNTIQELCTLNNLYKPTRNSDS